MSLWTRVRNAFRPEGLDRDLEEELRLHIDAAIAAGRSPEEVRRRFGNVTRIRESSRDPAVREKPSGRRAWSPRRTFVHS